MPSESLADTAVTVSFAGPKTKELAVSLDGRGAVTVLGLPKADGAKFFHRDKPNVLRVERSGKEKGYVIKLNDQQVGTAVPLSHAPGPFVEMSLMLGLKDGKRASPRVTSVRVLPLEDPNP